MYSESCNYGVFLWDVKELITFFEKFKIIFLTLYHKMEWANEDFEIF